MLIKGKETREKDYKSVFRAEKKEEDEDRSLNTLSEYIPIKKNISKKLREGEKKGV